MIVKIRRVLKHYQNKENQEEGEKLADYLNQMDDKELQSPVNFELDTAKLVDGHHTLKIVSKDPTGKEGIRLIPFEVRNGPAISIEGIKENAVVDGVVPIMINAYGKGDSKNFLIVGSETPQSIPFWVFILLISFVAWAIYYHIDSSAVSLLK